MQLVINVTGLSLRHVVTRKFKKGDDFDIKYIFVEFYLFFCPVYNRALNLMS